MRIFMSMACKQALPFLNFPGGGMGMESFTVRRPKDKVVFVMGATGTGKSKLSIDLATRFPAEIVNSDKMQVYEGLDIVTNKVTEEEQRGIPHHLLGVVDPDADFTALDFCRSASHAIESIVSRDRLPIIVGGSNSYIHALVNDDLEFRSRYECCFLWVDVCLPVLHSSVSKRVDRMVEAGLVDEVRRFFEPEADYSRGIRRAIGVPEMDRFLRAEASALKDEEILAILLEEAIEEIKVNTCTLARCQLQKIYRLKELLRGKMHCLDATEVFLKHGKEAEETWEKLVAGPGTNIVRHFFYKAEDHAPTASAAAATIKAAVMGKAVAAATR